jgi:C-terminal processing protease CtpA/Prc/Tol biopolymer transport system component
MKKLALTLLGWGISLCLPAQSFVRHAQLSPDGQSLAFSYQGDIWYWPQMEGKPQRLTLHEAYDARPVFHPTDNRLAFTSSRFGNTDIFSLNLDGGYPERLTYHAASDNLSDWHKDLGVLFHTERAFVTVEWDAEIHRIAPNNATPQRFMDGLGSNAVASPDGRYIAFMRGSCRSSRENYSGPADQEIWLYDLNKGSYMALTDNEVNDINPQWLDNNTLVFLSAKEGRYNLKKLSLAGEATWLSDFKDEGIHDFSLAGSKLLFARKDLWYLGELSKASAAKALNLDLKSDYRFYPVERETIRNRISNYSLSPNGKEVVLETRGEIFIGALDDEKSRTTNLSDHSYYDREAIFLNDTTVVFTSDREANSYRFYKSLSADEQKSSLFESLRHKTELMAKADGDLRDAVLAPNGKLLAYVEGGTKLQVSEVKEDGSLGSTTTLHDAWYGAGGIAWSPDSRYIAYHRSDLNFNREIYIQAADGSTDAVNISMHPGSDYGATWSKDGSKLAFISDRSNDDADVWFVWLQREDWLKSKEEREEGYYFDEEETEDSKDEEKDEDKETLVQIDFENIHDRLEQVTYYSGSESQVLVSADGETFYFTRQTAGSRGIDLFEVQFDGSDLKQLTQGGISPTNLQWDKDGKGIYFLSRGSLKHINPASKKITSYSYSEKMTIDKAEERKQVYEEASRLIRDRFYDPEYHGENWSALTDYYRPWALKASTTEDFNFVYNLMLGRLNASHMGLYGSNGDTEVQRESTGRIGIEVSMANDGATVTRLVANTPADRTKNNLQLGDRITHINGEAVNLKRNFYSYWTATVGEPVLVQLDRGGTKMEIVIHPSSSINSQLYEEWVASRKALVEKYSKGRLGYIHIRGMDMQSFERFERELMASGYGKEGIVIDVRFNGGGWTTDYLMAVLNVRQHAYTIPRGATNSLKNHQDFSNYYPYSERLPLAAWTKPSVALCNESSYSNAEIFSHAYKSLGIGTLVGKPTFGAVISTGGSGLLNGSFLRLPFRAWYVKNSGQNMENGPAVPDVVLDNPPASRANGDDAQLAKAVEILLEQINNSNK